MRKAFIGFFIGLFVAAAAVTLLRTPKVYAQGSNASMNVAQWAGVNCLADPSGHPLYSSVPPGASITASANATASASNATLAGTAGKTTYITGFCVTGTGATGASTITVTVTGTITGTLNYTIGIPASVGANLAPIVVSFPTPVPASAANTPIVVNVPSFGAGSTGQSCSAYGFQL